MSAITIGIVDYGFGNHASVVHCLRELGCRVLVSEDSEVLAKTQILILPGVGAFPAAMQALHERGLVDFLRDQAFEQKPILGICLGMQLLVSASHEIRYTTGLDIIPGEIVPLSEYKWHIGWNELDCVKSVSWLRDSDRQSFYFNHAYGYQGDSEYQLAICRFPDPGVAVICKEHTVGLQFHPEKSQAVGWRLLQNFIAEFADA
jgi:glutamine amidotransferase